MPLYWIRPKYTRHHHSRLPLDKFCRRRRSGPDPGPGPRSQRADVRLPRLFRPAGHSRSGRAQHMGRYEAHDPPG